MVFAELALTFLKKNWQNILLGVGILAIIAGITHIVYTYKRAFKLENELLIAQITQKKLEEELAGCKGLADSLQTAITTQNTAIEDYKRTTEDLQTKLDTELHKPPKIIYKTITETIHDGMTSPECEERVMQGVFKLRDIRAQLLQEYSTN